MVKAPSSHGLDRKFKPWRKGKSEKSNRRSSLKQQLRGLERLLKKAKDQDHARQIDSRIQEVKLEIAEREAAERQKSNAKESHGTRFLERQKLVRLEKSARKNPNLTPSQREHELTRIAVDQVYVAHFPTDTKYLPLFRHGVRRKDSRRFLVKRAKIRRDILSRVSTDSKTWVQNDQYKRSKQVTKGLEAWSVDLERQFFGELSQQESGAPTEPDARFQTSEHHEKLEHFAQLEESNMDGTATREQQGMRHAVETSDGKQDDSLFSTDGHHSLEGSKKPPQDDTDSDSSSSNNEVSTDEENPQSHETEDDFFVEANGATDQRVFDRPTQRLSAIDRSRGDKSKGWETQKQRPGQFKSHKKWQSRSR